MPLWEIMANQREKSQIALDEIMTTEEALEKITDLGAFEKLVTEVLRAADLFFSGANRSHLPLFDRLVAGNSLKSTLQSQVHFGVKYRTLS